VLLNHRHHLAQRRKLEPSCTSLDPASSGRWFDGWCIATAPPHPTDGREVAPPRTWLMRVGWRRHRLIDPAEVPG
jgi:hypothetical protein